MTIIFTKFLPAVYVLPNTNHMIGDIQLTQLEWEVFNIIKELQHEQVHHRRNELRRLLKYVRSQIERLKQVVWNGLNGVYDGKNKKKCKKKKGQM